jgi:hypothetical protein
MNFLSFTLQIWQLHPVILYNAMFYSYVVSQETIEVQNLWILE